MVSLLFKMRLFIVKCQVGARYDCQRAQARGVPSAGNEEVFVER